MIQKCARENVRGALQAPDLCRWTWQIKKVNPGGALYLLLSATLLSSCAHDHPPYDKMRVAILEIHADTSKFMRRRDGELVPLTNERRIRASMEGELLKRNITVVDDAESAVIKDRLNQAKLSGVHTTATDINEYQPAATHGIMLETSENISLLSVITLGLLPYPVETSARMIDLRTGEVRASLQTTTYGLLWSASSGATYRGAREISRKIAAMLHKIQAGGRNLRPTDWPTNKQRDSTDPSAQGRYTHAIYLAMAGSDDQALESLEEAVRMDKTFAGKAHRAWEFNSLRDNARFQAITKEKKQSTGNILP